MKQSKVGAPASLLRNLTTRLLLFPRTDPEDVNRSKSSDRLWGFPLFSCLRLSGEVADVLRHCDCAAVRQRFLIPRFREAPDSYSFTGLGCVNSRMTAWLQQQEVGARVWGFSIMNVQVLAMAHGASPANLVRWCARSLGTRANIQACHHQPSPFG